ncbi:hypothetical protein AB0K89_24550 [Streptomyces cinnamoneus]|uniref:hypothetical protein n=1 Tax=Streptomyces cinnamoneus TaxID=53446 RepID=UPI003431CF2D
MAEGGKTWWLCTEFTDTWVDGTTRPPVAENEDLKRQAELAFEHAEYRVSRHQNKFDRIDAILALKRSMQTRLDHLDELYNLRQYPESKSVGWLGVLESWGVIRQRMLRRMRQLRNAVEHDGAEPPTIEDCQDYCEVAWWFLRGTAPILTPISSLELYFDEGNFWIRVDYNPVRIFATGNILPEMISDAPVDGWVKVTAIRDERRGMKGVMTPCSSKEAGKQYMAFLVTDPGEVAPFLRLLFKEFL